MPDISSIRSMFRASQQPFQLADSPVIGGHVKPRSILYLNRNTQRSIALLLCTMIALAMPACTLGQSQPQNPPTPNVPSETAVPPKTPTSPAPAPVNDHSTVVIDTDMARDDWMAILFLLNRPDVIVKAITVTGTGEAHCGPGVANALKLVALAGHAPIPVACGRDAPLEGNHAFPEAWRDAVDNLAGLNLPNGTNPEPGMTAVQLLAQVLEASPGAVQVLALGPLTNLAEAFQGDSTLAQHIAMVYVMGGAVHVPGNVSADVSGNTTAEWNIYVDPRAANMVFASGAPVTLVGLDATNHVPLTSDFYQELQASHARPSSTFVYDLLGKMQDFIRSGNYYFWDPLAAGILTDPSLASFEQDALCVVEDEGSESGRTKIADGCPSVRVAASADASEFERMFMEALNAPPSAALDVTPLVGTWAGTARGGNFQMQITIGIFDSCAQGAICGNFDIPTLPCSGDFVLVGMSADGMFELSAVNKKGTCGSARDFLQAQPDGTLLYVSRSPSGETRGNLSKAVP
jgi:inosine-uridine nucleoside N-ribohydrolase